MASREETRVLTDSQTSCN